MLGVVRDPLSVHSQAFLCERTVVVARIIDDVGEFVGFAVVGAEQFVDVLLPVVVGVAVCVSVVW